jgi:two-component system OmpR family sensor kinase
LLQNLLENALRPGSKEAPVTVTLHPDATLRAVNAGPVVPPETLRDLTHRFHRGNSIVEGSGLGLGIVDTIVQGTGGTLDIQSPETGHKNGFEAVVRLGNVRDARTL